MEIKAATVVVHWPGKDTPACEHHASQLINLGRVLGVLVTTSPCKVLLCANCCKEKLREIEMFLDAPPSP